MAYFTIKFFSKSLNRYTSFEMFIPNDRPENSDNPLKTVFLLHGLTGCAGNSIPESLAEKYNFAIVMPTGENAFWLDGISTGHKFCTFVGEELPSYIRKTFNLTLDGKNTYIMGISMGGFGAVHTALAYPKQFSKIGAMSSAFIVHEVAKMKEGDYNGVANFEYYRECFGEPKNVLESENNPETLVKNLIKNGEEIPQIFMSCGTEDFLIENNRDFHKFLEENGVSHTYYECDGEHNMDYWNKLIPIIIKWMFEEK